MRNLTLSFGVLVLLAIGDPLPGAGPYRYLAQVAELNSPIGEAPDRADALGLSHDRLPGGRVARHRGDRHGRINWTAMGSPPELASYGLTLTAMYRQGPLNGFHRWLAVGPGNGFPTYQDTGDPMRRDQATYVAAKEAWYEDHAEPKNDLTKAGQ